MKRTFLIMLWSILAVGSYAQNMFDVMLQKAQAGDSKAQNNVAAYYRDGYGVQQNYREAIYWYRKSAAQGDPLGLYGLGQCYATGIGVEQNLQTAAGYILSAAQKGLKKAQQTIAYMYEHGLGVTQDFHSANYWNAKANE